MKTGAGMGTPLQEWANAHEPSKSLSWGTEYWKQIMFVRDRIPAALQVAGGYERETIWAGMRVIAEHTARSVCLPVFHLTLPDDTAFTMSYNFADWKVSVESPRDVEVDFMSLFDPKRLVGEVECSGFPDQLVYGPYAKNKRQFTVGLPDEHHVFTFFWTFAYGMKHIRKGKKRRL
jgi:hypothetical protein